METRKNIQSFTVLDIYKHYCKTNTEKLDEVQKEIFYDILNDFNERVSNEMKNSNFDFYLPCGLGNISVRKRKQKSFKSIIDWKSTKEVWKDSEEDKLKKTLIYELNSHTDGYTMSWRWERGYKNFFKNLYKFIHTRYNKRHLAKLIKQNQIDFLNGIH